MSILGSYVDYGSATRLSFLGLVAIISGKNLYKSDRDTCLMSSILAMISTEIHNDYGHSRGFWFNSVLFLFIKDFTTLSSSKSQYYTWLGGVRSMLMATSTGYCSWYNHYKSFESSLQLRCWNTCYKGRVNERYNGWSYQSYFQSAARSMSLIC